MDFSKKRNTQSTGNLLEQCKTLWFKGGLLAFLQGKYVTVYKIIANNQNKAKTKQTKNCKFFFAQT